MNEFLIILLAIITLLQVGYYGFFFQKFAYTKKVERNHFNQPVSIIISCRNEAENLKKNLPFILNQQYPAFEIVLVNDASTDNTSEVMQSLANKYDKVKVFEIAKELNDNGNKKKALSFGIQHAQYEHLIFTDADCYPTSTQWISEISKGFNTPHSIVLGYGSYAKKNTFLNKIIRYETLLTAWQYFSYAAQKLTYMGVGRNLAYTKSLFYKKNGFQAHAHILSGDDDLFVQMSATETNTALIWHSESHTVSEPKTKLIDWFNQKKRHVSTSFYYKPIIKSLLSLFYLTQILFYSILISLLVFYPPAFLVIFIALVRYIVYYYTLIPVAKKLKENDLVFMAPFYEFLLILFQGVIFISNAIDKPKQW